MLETISRHSRRLAGVEGKGVVTFEYRGQRGDVPFRVLVGPAGLVQVDAEIAPTARPGLGRLKVVSDDNGTQIYGSQEIRDFAARAMRPAALRALVLSLFGGGNLVVGWLGSNGCMIRQSTTCQGLDVRLSLDRARRAIEKWEINDKTSKFGFSGLVYAWERSGSRPRVVKGVIHPQEITLTVTFDEAGLAWNDASVGNFIWDTALQ
jgi:hypothetical protein